MVAKYWKTILARAWADSLRTIRYENGTQLVLALLFALAVIFALYLFGSTDAWKDESIVKAVPFALALIGFPAILVRNLIAAPARIYSEQNEKIATLSAALVPTVSVTIAEGSGFTRADYGITSTSLAGTKQTTITGGTTFAGLLIDCKNVSTSSIERCEAFLVDVQRQGPTGSLEAFKIDAIPLAWMPVHKDRSYQTSIPSQGYRRAVGLRKIGNHIYFPTDSVPARYIHIFEEPGVFLLKIMVCPFNAASVPLNLKLVTGGEPTIEPVPNG